MNNTNGLGMLSYFRCMHKKEFDTLTELSLENPIVLDMLKTIESGMMTPVEALTACITALSIVNDKLLKSLIEHINITLPPRVIIQKPEKS